MAVQLVIKNRLDSSDVFIEYNNTRGRGRGERERGHIKRRRGAFDCSRRRSLVFAHSNKDLLVDEHAPIDLVLLYTRLAPIWAELVHVLVAVLLSLLLRHRYLFVGVVVVAQQEPFLALQKGYTNVKIMLAVLLRLEDT